MDEANILDLFYKLTGLTSDTADIYTSIVQDAIELISSRLKKDQSEYTEYELIQLENACTYVAFYEYTALTLARENRVYSELGKIKLDYSANLRLTAAKAARDAALIGISPLIEDDGFIFCCV